MSEMVEFDNVAAAAEAYNPAVEEGLWVAFASLEGDMVDQHFGSARGFFVHHITRSGSEYVTCKRFAQEKKDGNEDKLKPKMAFLVGCDLVYCGSIGGSATRQLVALGVTPKKVTGGPDVEDLIADLQAEWSSGDSFWLQNILSRKQKSGGSADFALSEQEDWS